MAEAVSEIGMPEYPSPEYILRDQLPALEKLFGSEKMNRILATMREVTAMIPSLDSSEAEVAATISQMQEAVIELAAAHRSQKSQSWPTVGRKRKISGEEARISEENIREGTSESNHKQIVNSLNEIASISPWGQIETEDEKIPHDTDFQLQIQSSQSHSLLSSAVDRKRMRKSFGENEDSSRDKENSTNFGEEREKLNVEDIISIAVDNSGVKEKIFEEEVENLNGGEMISMAESSEGKTKSIGEEAEKVNGEDMISIEVKSSESIKKSIGEEAEKINGEDMISIEVESSEGKEKSFGGEVKNINEEDMISIEIESSKDKKNSFRGEAEKINAEDMISIEVDCSDVKEKSFGGKAENINDEEMISIEIESSEGEENSFRGEAEKINAEDMIYIEVDCSDGKEKSFGGEAENINNEKIISIEIESSEGEEKSTEGDKSSAEEKRLGEEGTSADEDWDTELPWVLIGGSQDTKKLRNERTNAMLPSRSRRRIRRSRCRVPRGGGWRRRRTDSLLDGLLDGLPDDSGPPARPDHADTLDEVLRTARARADKLRNKQPINEEVDDEEMGVAETYADYKPAKLGIGRSHPDPVVETASLSSVEPVDVTYEPSLPRATVAEGRVSALQLEAVVYACQAHEKMLPDHTRAGFLIGDGAGVGKGRTVAAVIFENWLKGRKRAIWVSVSSDLKYDAARDLRDIGAEMIKVHPLNKFQYKKMAVDGVVFCTYSSLIGHTASPTADFDTRVKQLVHWCGADFDGCIVFDECHRAKNLCPAGSGKSTKTGRKVLELQNLLPDARVVYASATGASEPRNMAYMVRLVIWGEGTPFPAFPDFMDAVQTRGVGAMEIVAMDMKLRGMYIARQLSFHGVTIKIEEVPLSEPFKHTYDMSVKLWVKALEKFSMALEMISADPMKRKVVWGQFWSAHQRFFKHLCIAAKVEQAVAVAREAVSRGKCVVIGLQSTGEASTLAQLERDVGEITEFVSCAKGVFQGLVERHFPIEIVCPMQTELLDSIERLSRRLPPNALDQLIGDLGGNEAVAEMTGRKGRVVRRADGQVEYQSRAEKNIPLEELNLTEKQRFMDGDKLIAVISEAASVGISLQSDKRAKNQRKRVHITLELPWSADRAIQQFGRTHRSNQVNAPEYIFLISDLAGERRFASTVAKRLESLGALTHGDRRATETRDLSQFNIDNKYGRTALRAVMEAMRKQQSPLVAPPSDYSGDFFGDVAAALFDVRLIETTEVTLAADYNMTRFLNRILGLPVELQNRLFKYFTDTLEEVINQAKRSGRFDLGIVDLGSAGDCVRRVRCVRFLRRHATGAAPVELHTVHTERGITWEDASLKCEKLTLPFEGFYVPKGSAKYGRTTVLCASDRSHDNMMQIYKPNIGRLARLETLTEVQRKYKQVSVAAARDAWRQHYAASERVCSHRYQSGSCALGDTCEVGLRFRKHHVLSGSLLTVWALVEDVLAERSHLPHMQVVRVKTSQGLKIVGTVIPRSCLEQLTKALTCDAISVDEQTFGTDALTSSLPS